MSGLTMHERQGVSRFDLSIHFTRYANGIVVALTYNTDLFKKERMLRLGEHLGQLLELLGKNTELPVRELQLMSEDELSRLLSFNQTEKNYGQPVCLPQLFEAQVTQTPDALAVQCGKIKLTYNELNSRANQLAHYLRKEYSISAGSRVGIMMDRSERMIITLLAILKAGAAYVPIDPAYPADRCKYMANDSDISLLVTDNGYGRWHEGNLLRWNEADWQHCATENPDCINTSDDLVYIIYTSGSTGKPKGVMIPHRALFNLCNWLKELLYDKEARVVMVTASISFDASVKQLFPPLVSGSALQIISEEERTSPVKYIRALQEGGTNVTDLTPSFLQLLLQAIKENNYKIGSLQYMLAGGEILQKQTVRLFYELLPHAKLINVYGPTETCVDASFKVIDEFNEDYLSSIGKPLPNVNVFITDGFLQPVPAGIFGELLIGGTGLAQGYCNQPELTAEKFITHPQFGCLYRTGDLARWNDQGEIEFSGRRDGQVKMRGYRIEIAEIENRIVAHPEVKDAAVVYTNLQGHEELNAFVVWKNGSSVNELYQFLQQSLPAYMVPSGVYSIEALPKAPGGKNDRKALIERIAAIDRIDEHYAAPENESESILVEIWEELLQQKPIGIDDDFWQRGGHSLKAMRMMVMIFSKLKVEVSIRDIFETRTIRRLAAVINGQSATEYIPIAKVQDGQAAYPLSHAQKRLWIIHQLEEQLSAYNIVHTYSVPVSIEEQAFSKAVQYMVERHEILRTVFVEREATAMQVIIDVESFQPSVKYYNIIHEENKQALIDKAVQGENNRVFDLQQGPLFTISLFRTATAETSCVLNMHHIISDAWSVNIFKRELEEAYQAYAQNISPALKPLAYRYKDYAAWLNEKTDSGELAASRNYWKETLSGELPVLEVPADLPRPARKTYRGKQCSLMISAQTMKQIRQISEHHGCSPFTFFYTCLNALLHRYTHQDDLITGMPVAGRDRAELQDQLGFYVNVLPFRLRLKKDISFSLLLQQVRDQLVQQLAHQSYPFDQIVEDLDLKKDLSRSPIFDVLVNHQRHEVPAGDLSFSLQTDGESSFSKFDLSFDFVEFTDAALLSISYNIDLFLEETAERMLLYFEELLNDAMLHPGKMVQELHFVPLGEQALINEVFNDTVCPQPWNKTVIELLEQQAAENSEAIALQLNNSALTYHAFNEKVNQAAHFLRNDRAVKPGDRVGVMVARSEQMVLAIYAILKSGAAYVPIDPSYPLQRKLFMIKDSEVKFVITENDHFLELDCAVVNWHAIEFSNYSKENPNTVNTADDPVYMIYTSGSTGNPKGVLVQHASLTNLCQWYHEFIEGISSHPLRIYLNASINFDVSVGQLFGALASGSTLIISPEEIKTDPYRLVDFLNRHKADLIDITPSFLQVLLLHLKESGSACSLRYVLAAGEILTTDTCNLFSEIFSSRARLFNLYGPTEACVYTTVEEVILPIAVQYNTIGYPLLNANVRVLDESQQQTGIGVWGELFIGGAGLAAGYWKRGELTREKFIHHPQYGRLYRTGDLGRWNSKGLIEFRGRNDQQVKLRGFRIELGEVEQAIRLFAAGNEVVVIYNDKEKQLIAFVASREPQEEQLKEFLSDRLPAYMVPAKFIVLNQLPKTSSGKIDRVLLQQQSALAVHHAIYKAASTDTEHKLLDIWRDILSVSTVGVDDNFFELGGHSLKAMRMVSVLYKEFGVKLSIRDIFLYQTPQRLAKFIDAQSKDEYLQIEKIAPAEYHVTSSGQRSIWFAAQQEGGAQAYNMVLRYSWKKIFDINAYRQAWTQLLDRHESLRTVFVTREGEVLQKIKLVTETEAAIEFEDLCNQSATVAEQSINMLALAQQRHVFDLSDGPLIRCS
ncbi:MAG: amino acid adenylation domain-containing protein, partial [Chitinophagaceae bacterium]